MKERLGFRERKGERQKGGGEGESGKGKKGRRAVRGEGASTALGEG